MKFTQWNRIFRRSLSALLALGILCGMMPMTIFATEGTAEIEATEATEVTEVTGETETTEPEVIHEHAYEAVAFAPTCTEKGYATYTCECGDSYVAGYIEAHGHIYSGRCDEICNICNNLRKIYHDPDILWSADADNHWHSCTCCRTAFDTEKHTFATGFVPFAHMNICSEGQ